MPPLPRRSKGKSRSWLHDPSLKAQHPSFCLPGAPCRRIHSICTLTTMGDFEKEIAVETHTTPFTKHSIIQGHEPECQGPHWDLNTGPLTSVGCTHSTLISWVNNLPISVDGLPLGSQLIPSTVHSFNQHSLRTDQSPDTSELGKQRQSHSQ